MKAFSTYMRNVLCYMEYSIVAIHFTNWKIFFSAFNIDHDEMNSASLDFCELCIAYYGLACCMENKVEGKVGEKDFFSVMKSNK